MGCDLFLSAVDEHIPKCTSKNVNDHPWIDKELLSLIREKNRQRKKDSPTDFDKFKLLRRKSKQLISKKKKDHTNKLRESVFENPKRFWLFIKSSTKINHKPNFLRDGQKFISDRSLKANLLNNFFYSVFSDPTVEPPTAPGSTPPRPATELFDIQLTAAEVVEVLRALDPNKVCDPDGIPVNQSR